MAVGVLIVAHYQLGEQFLQSLRLILPDAPAFASISIEPSDSLDAIKMKIQEDIYPISHQLFLIIPLRQFVRLRELMEKHLLQIFYNKFGI